MPPWRLLVILLPLFIGYGLAGKVRDVTGSAVENTRKSKSQGNTKAGLEESANESKGNGTESSLGIMKSSSKVNKIAETLHDEDLVGSDTQTLLRHQDPYTSSPFAPGMSPYSSPLHHQRTSSSSSNSQPSTGSLRPRLRPLLVPNSASTRPSSAPSQTKPTPSATDSSAQGKTFKNNKNENRFKKNMNMQRLKSYQQLTPIAVLTTTTAKPKMNPVLSSPRGIMIKPKGKSMQMVSLQPTEITESNNHANHQKPSPRSNEKVKSGSKPRSNGHTGGRLSRAMLHTLTARPQRHTSKSKAAQTSPPAKGHHTGTTSGLEKKIVKKHISKMEADKWAASWTHRPPSVQEEENASPSVPLVIVTTQRPIITKVMHNKLIESRTFKTPSYMYRGAEGFHDPLHSMYGPPYDHYKFSAHRSPGGSFPPPPLPFYQTNQEFLHERIVHTEVPHQLPTPPKKHVNKSEDTSPYFTEEPIFLAPSPPPSPPPSTTSRPPTPPSSSYDSNPPPKKTPKSLTYNDIDDPYFQPHDHLNPVAKKKKNPSVVKAKAFKTEKSPPQRNNYAVSRYSAISDGIPGVDYPVYSRIPYTTFTCKDRRPPGIYGDAEAGCQVWHICEADGRQHSFLCPNGTIFNQQLLTCDWWYNVYCSATEEYYNKKPSVDVYKPHLNHLPTTDHKLAKSISLPKSQKKSNWSPYSHLNPTKRPVRVNHYHHAPYPLHLTPPPSLRKPSILSPRGIKDLKHVQPGLAPFMEFQPYHHHTYPMFQIRKRHAREEKI